MKIKISNSVSHFIIVDVETKEETVLVDEEGYFGGAHVFTMMTDTLHMLGADRTFKNATHSNLYVYDTEDGRRMNLTESIDAPVGD